MKKYLNLIAVGLLFWLGTPYVVAAFGQYRTVTVDHTKVPNTDQSNFPVEVASTTYSFLKTVGNGGKVQHAQGFDIGFYTNPDCSTGKMAWEVERYLPTTGDVVFFVKNGTLSHTTDTVFYLCYGDASITTDQSATTTVWDSNFKGVWHLPNGVVLSAKDSTSNGVNSTSIIANATTGQIGGGASFNAGGSNGIHVGSGSNFPKDWFSNDFSLSVWVQSNDLGGTRVIFQSSDGQQGWGLATVSGGQLDAFDRNVADHLLSAASLSTGKRYFISMTRDHTSTTIVSRLYNATDGGLSTGSNNVTYTNTNSTDSGSALIGKLDFDGFAWGGMIDEVRVSEGVKRSSDWFDAEFNNGLFPDKTASSTAGFYTMGAETPVSAGGGATASTPRFVLPLGQLQLLLGKLIIN
jgi:Concanavalin A-like lectin/glucanases superfamily